MLINLSNHPSEKWGDTQKKAAAEYGEIKDIDFPNIPPGWDTEQVEDQVKICFKQIREIEKREKQKPVIHLSGELTFCLNMACKLIKNNYRVIASTTERNVKESGGVKTSVFEFKQFRDYSLNECRAQPTRKQNNSPAIRYWALISILVAEISSLLLINSILLERTTGCVETILLLILLVLSVASVLFLFYRNRTENFFTLKTQIASKIFANIIKPEPINVVFLLTFLVHIGCLGSVFYSIFASETGSGLWLHIIIMSVVLLTSLYLIYIFPNPKERGKNGNVIFFSGIPVPSFVPFASHDLDEEVKRKEGTMIENLNYYPIVRIFYVLLTGEQNIVVKDGDKLHLLLSRDINEQSLKVAFNRLKEPIGYSGKYGSANAVMQFNAELKKIKADFDAKNDYKMFIRRYIRALGKYAFSDKKQLCEAIENIEINFTPTVNYNDFDNIYNKAKVTLDEYEFKEYSIIINCSPGTATVSSALTILSMEKNRKLLYYSQDSKVDPDYKMQEIMENKLSIKDVIEKVSEELSNDSV